jgi:hypothetical protein
MVHYWVMEVMFAPINLSRLHFYTDGVFYGGVSELVTFCACLLFKAETLRSMEGADEAATTPSHVFVLLMSLLVAALSPYLQLRPVVVAASSRD